MLTWLESSAAVLYSSLYLLGNSQAAVSALSSPVHVCRWRLRCLVLGCQSLVANRFVDCSLSFVERTANGTGHLLGHRCVRDTRQGSICSSGFGSICSSGFVTKLSFSGGRGGDQEAELKGLNEPTTGSNLFNSFTNQTSQVRLVVGPSFSLFKNQLVNWEINLVTLTQTKYLVDQLLKLG